MYRNCTTKESALRQRQFELLLLEKMAEKTYAQITVGTLCQEVGISRNAFYRYFDSKEDVLNALIDHALLDCYQAQPDYPKSMDQFYREMEVFLQYWKEQKPLLDALQKNGLDGTLLQRCLDHSMQRHFDHHCLSILGSGDRRAQMMMFAINGLFTLILDWHHKGYRQTIAQMREVLGSIILKPLVAFPEF